MAKEENKELKHLSAGLDDKAAAAGKEAHGENIITPPPPVPIWKLYLEKYKDPVIQILLVAAAISLVLAFVEKEYIETIGIFVAIFLATTIGFIFEVDAARKFRMLTEVNDDLPVKVRRNGRVTQIRRRDVTVGDVVVIETGDEVPADGDLIESIDLKVDESSLTGEPEADKHADTSKAEGDAAAYPPGRVLRGSMVMDGSGIYVVRSIGDETEIGTVSRNSQEHVEVQTPLQLQLAKLAKIISKAGLTISIVAFFAFLLHDLLTGDIWHSGDYVKMAERVLTYFMMSVTLIVMAVPEGLPMAITLSLALNMRRMLKSNCLVRNMQATETVGAVTVICSDKTGTLTQNKMSVAKMSMLCDKDTMVKAIAINSTAHLDDEGKFIGNPSEGALLMWTAAQGADYRKIRQEAQITARKPFSTEYKYMTTTVNEGGTQTEYIKGAPEKVMAMCDMSDDQRKQTAEEIAGYQNEGMRTLAFAMRKAGQEKATFMGATAISDPIRPDVKDAIEKCHRAGIEVKLITGDVTATAKQIARQAGILDDKQETTPAQQQIEYITGAEFEQLSDEEAAKAAKSIKVMSRARPADKQRLVNLLQQQGAVVAVTGDGTNDAPALHHAHVGLSLGSGTSVAKNASDITILDDSFQSIAKAVMWGRSLYRNIQRFLFFQLVVNVTALLLVIGGSLIGTELPLTVTQILWINLIMDTFAAMALASLPPSREVMKDKPRDKNDFILSKSIQRGILWVGGIFFIIMFAYLIYVEYHNGQGIDRYELTMFFTAFVMLQWWNLFNAKSVGSSYSAFHRIIYSPWFLAVMAAILIGQWIIVQFGGDMFRVTPLKAIDWLKIIVCTSPVLIIGEIYRKLFRAKILK